MLFVSSGVLALKMISLAVLLTAAALEKFNFRATGFDEAFTSFS
jgi:hypothetical protein